MNLPPPPPAYVQVARDVAALPGPNYGFDCVWRTEQVMLHVSAFPVLVSWRGHCHEVAETPDGWIIDGQRGTVTREEDGPYVFNFTTCIPARIR